MDFSDIVQTPEQTPPEQPPTVQKKPYWQVLDEYDKARATEPELAKLTVPEFSQKMNEAAGTQEYDEGLSSGLLRKAGGAIERGLRHFGGTLPGEERLFGIPTPSEMVGGPQTGFDIPAAAKEFGKSTATQLGAGPELAEKIGGATEGLPKTGLTIGLGAGLAGLPGIAALSGLETYGETGRVLPAAISAGTAYAIPKLAEVGGQAALKALGAKTVGEIKPELASLMNKKLPETTELLAKRAPALGWGPAALVQRTARLGGAQVGMLGGGIAGEAAQTAVDPTLTWQEKLKQVGSEFTPSSLVAAAVGQLPFTAYDIFNERTHPLTQIEDQTRDAFRARFKAAALKGDPETGSPPFIATEDQVNKAIQGLTKGQVEPDSPIGAVLKSMGDLPVVPDLKTPVITADEAWPMTVAMDSTRERTKNMLKLQGVDKDIGNSYDQTIYAGLRAAETAGKGKLSKEATEYQAASFAANRYLRDQKTLDYQGKSIEKTLTREDVARNEPLMAEIADSINPESPNYNKEAHQRIALATGDPEHWVAAGITEPVMTATAADPIPLRGNIVDLYTGLNPVQKPSLDPRITSKQGEVFALDREARELQTIELPSPEQQDRFNAIRAQREILTDEIDVLQKEVAHVERKRFFTTKTGQPKGEIWGTSTAAAVERAYNYGSLPEDRVKGRVLDLKDPESVRKFAGSIRQAISRAEIDATRESTGRAVQRTLEMKYGANEDAAVEEAKRLTADAASAPGDSTLVYDTRFDKRTGDWRVVEYRQAKRVPFTDVEPTEADKEQLQADWEPTTLADRGVDIHEIADNVATNQFGKLRKLDDPAESAARMEALAQNVTYYLERLSDNELKKLILAGADEKYGKGTAGVTIQKVDLLRKRYIRYVQFLRDHGVVDLQVEHRVPEKVEKVSEERGRGVTEVRPISAEEELAKRTQLQGPRLVARDREQLLRLNEFMHGGPENPNGLGFGVYSTKHPRAGEVRTDKWNEGIVSNLNFFEQFGILMSDFRKKIPNPKSFEDAAEILPRGDFGFLPPNFREQALGNLLIKWGQGLPEKGGFRGPEGRIEPTYPSPGKPIAVMFRDRQGREVGFKRDQNPLLTFFTESAKRELTMPLSQLLDLFDQHGQLDPINRTMLTLVRKLANVSPFIRDMPVGSGVASDSRDKAYYHTDTVSSSAGMLLSPFKSIDPTYQGGRYVRELMNPNEIFPHFMNEVGHSATDFAYLKNPEFQKEVNKIFEHVQQYVEERQMVTGGDSEWTKAPLHSLTNPREFLAGIFNDYRLHQLLGEIRDPFEPLPGVSAIGPVGSLFERIKTAISNMLTNLFGIGSVEANTLLNRMSSLASTGFEWQQSLNLRHRGDIYQEAVQRRLISGDILGPKPQRRLRRDLTGQDLIFAPSERETPPPQPTGITAGMAPPEQAAREQLSQAQMNLRFVMRGHERDPISYTAEDISIAEKAVRIAENRIAAGAVPQNISFVIRNHESLLADLQARLGKAQVFGYGEVMPDLQRQITEQETMLAGLRRQQQLKGSMLESRADPQPVLDSMQSAALYLHEDPNNIWFRPYDPVYFRDTYGPAFGHNLRLEERGGEVGYSISKNSVNTLTEQNLAMMPRPIVKAYAPSLFETLTSMYRNQGSDQRTANAMATQMLQFGALLKDTDRTYWGKLPTTEIGSGKLLGMAWGWSKVAGLTPETIKAGNRPIDYTIRHEGAHVAGMHDDLVHEVPDVQAAYKQVTEVFNTLDENGRKAFLEGLGAVTEEDGKYPGVYPTAVTDPIEFAAEYMGHVGDVISNIPKPSVYLRNQMRFVPDEMSRLLIKSTLRRMQGLGKFVESIEQYARTRGVKDVNWINMVNDVAEAFKPLARSALDIANDQAEFYRARGLYADGYKGLLNTMAQDLEEWGRAQQATVPGATPTIPGEILASKENIVNTIRNFFTLPDPSGKLPRKLGFWDRFLTNFSQFADKHPEARSAWDMFFNGRAMYNNFRIKMTTALAGAFEGNKASDDARTKAVHNFQNRPDLRKAFSNVALEMNMYGDHLFDEELGSRDGDVMTMNPQIVTGWLTPEWTRGVLKKYGVADKDIPTMMTVLDGTRNQVKYAQSVILSSAMHRMDAAMAVAVARNTDLPPEASRDAAKLLTDAVKMQATDIDGAMAKVAQFQQVVKDPRAFERMFDATNTAWEGIQKLERFLELRMPYFMSERRPGQFGLFFKDKAGKMTSRYFRNENERNKYISGNDIDPARMTNPGDRDWGISPQIFKQLDDVHARTVEKLKNLFGDKEGGELAATMDMASELRDALNSRDVLRLTTGRDLAPGREELDMFGAHQQYVNSIGKAAYNTFLRLETELLNTATDLDTQPAIKDFINKQVKQVMLPDSPIGRQAQNLSFLYYLWGNLSSMIMQSSHQVMGLAPMLTARGASVSGSFGTIAKANQLLIESKFGGKYKDPEIQANVDRARRDGTLGSWIARELDIGQDQSMINRMRATTGKGLWAPFDMLKNGLYQGYDQIRKLYDRVPIYNSEVALVASLLHLKSKTGGGLSGEQLYKEAQFLRSITMFTGGKENRPGFFQALPRSAAQAMWSLQTYANGLTTMMGELIRRSTNPKGMTPAQTKQTRKAAAQMLITQTAVAGVLGMPFAQAGLYALQKMFPEHNIEQDIRDALAALFGDDEQMGHAFSSIMTVGVPSSMDYSPDFGSRFALAGTFHVSPYSGVGWEQLVGPTGGVLSRAFDGMQAGLRGDPLQTVQDLMPNGFQRIWKALEQGGTYQTSSGQMVVSDLRPEEIVARMIGFRPSRVARIEDYERLSRASEDAKKAGQTRWTKEQVKLMMGGKDAEVQQNIAQRAASGEYPARQLSNDVGREYERTTMPANLRAFGNRSTILAQKSLRGVLGTQDEGPSNTERLLLQQSIAGRLGLGGPSRGSLRHAAGVDQLLSMYPHLTNAQANLLLTHAAASRPSPELYSALLGESGE